MDLVDEVGLDDVGKDGVAIVGDPLEVAVEVGQGARSPARRSGQPQLSGGSWLTAPIVGSGWLGVALEPAQAGSRVKVTWW